MATTTNYGWTTPDDTALVKDGASAIRALGTAIDTSMNTALGTKKSGLVLLNTTSFSAVSSQSVSNIMTDTYVFYRILINFVASVDNINLNLRFRENVTDKTTSYQSRGFFAGATTGSWADATDRCIIANTTNDTGRRSISVQDLGRLNAGAACYILGTSFDASNDRWRSNGARNYGMTNATGFTIYPDSGTITGTVRIYGCNE